MSYVTPPNRTNMSPRPERDSEGHDPPNLNICGSRYKRRRESLKPAAQRTRTRSAATTISLLRAARKITALPGVYPYQ